VLPVAMIAYSWALADAATERERREVSVLEAATARVRAAILGNTAALVGLTRDDEATFQAGAATGIRAALELALAQETAAAGDLGPLQVVGAGW
jgi:hypothetical protein